MTNVSKIGQIYKCDICGNIIEVLHVGGGELVCCGQPMELLNEKTKENEGREKHVPVIKRDEDGTIVNIGSIPHPMEEKHYIEWVELENKEKNKTCKKFLKPGEKPEGKFCAKTDKVKSRAYCNVHGLWKSE